MSESGFQQCSARRPTKVFSRYAWGDPMPHNALFVGEEGDTGHDKAITIYVRCEREAGHEGKHLASGTQGWMDDGRALVDG